MNLVEASIALFDYCPNTLVYLSMTSLCLRLWSWFSCPPTIKYKNPWWSASSFTRFLFKFLYSFVLSHPPSASSHMAGLSVLLVLCAGPCLLFFLPGIFFLPLPKHSSFSYHFPRDAFPAHPIPCSPSHFCFCIYQNYCDYWIFPPLSMKRPEGRTILVLLTHNSCSTSQALHICAVYRVAYRTLYSWRARVFWKSPLVVEMTSIYGHYKFLIIGCAYYEDEYLMNFS